MQKKINLKTAIKMLIEKSIAPSVEYVYPDLKAQLVAGDVFF